MSERHRLLLAPAALFCMLTIGGVSLPAQAPAPLTPAATPAAPAPAPDPLGRDTPFGTVTGFSAAVHRGDFDVAGRYLQTGRRTQAQIQTLATELSDLIDRYFVESLTSVSRLPAGDLADGFNADRDELPLAVGDRSISLFLIRVPDSTTGPVWLFSSESLARVPGLNRSRVSTWIEQVMPAELVDRSYRGISLAQWVLWAGSILVPAALFWMLAGVVALVARWRITDPTHRAAFLSGWRGLRWQVILALTLVVHLAMVPLLGFNLTMRYAYARVGLIAAVIVGAFLAWRLVSVTFHQAALVATRRKRSDTRSLLQLGERMAKVLVVLTAVFVLLSLAGVNMTTALAGVGIAGVALALGAQKSVENLIGGISLLTDRALAVGDYCRLLDREGWIEDITLRSIRLRTLEQTLLSVPAGLLAQGSIENFVSRGKILVRTVLRLRYGTTGDQLHAVLSRMQRLLSEHPSLERDTTRCHLISFGEQAIEIELFAYVVTGDYQQFVEIREQLLLQAAQIIEASGTGFAIPTQFIYMTDTPARLSPPRHPTAKAG